MGWKDQLEVQILPQMFFSGEHLFHVMSVMYMSLAPNLDFYAFDIWLENKLF